MEEDVTKTGPVGLTGLKGINQQQSNSPAAEYFRNLRKAPIRSFLPKAEENVGVRLGQAGYGDSTYDEAAMNLS